MLVPRVSLTSQYINVLIVLFIFFVFCSFFLSGSETAFLSLGKIRLKQIENLHDPASKRVEKLLRDPYKLLITIVVGNEIVNISASSIMSKLCYVNFGEEGILYSIVITIATLLVVGEVTPKMMALANASKYSLFASRPMMILERIFAPLRYMFTGAAYGIVRALGVNISHDHYGITKQEIRSILTMGKKSGVVNEKETAMVENILGFKDTNAADIMTPRINMIALDIGDDRQTIVNHVKDYKFSRFPVYIHSPDNIIGVIWAKDFLLHPSIPTKDLVRRVHFVPETKRVGDLLKEMQRKRMHLAIVTDEYGVTSGIVTIEDILEEIVGEIRDELDHEIPKINKIDDKTFEVSGQAHIDDVNKEVGLFIDTDEVDTIGGYIMLRLGKIPHAGDIVRLGDDAVIKVLDVSKNRVRSLEILKD